MPDRSPRPHLAAVPPFDLAHPHDGFVKAFFKLRRQAAGILRSSLDPGLVAAVDWASLEVVDGEQVDDALRQFRNDIVLGARLVDGGDVRFHFHPMVEHQREPLKRMPLRMMGYMGRFWELKGKDDPDRPLPWIVPMVLYNGDGPWSDPRAFIEQMRTPPPPGAESLLGFTPHFALRLLDIHDGRLDDFALDLLTALGCVALVALGSAGKANVFKRAMLAIASRVAASRDDPDFQAAWALILRYLRATQPRDNWSETVEIVETATGVPGNELVPDLFEEIREEGRIQGRALGRDEGRIESLLVVATQRFGAIAPGHEQRIRSADPAHVKEWFSRILTAATVDELLREP